MLKVIAIVPKTSLLVLFGCGLGWVVGPNFTLVMVWLGWWRGVVAIVVRRINEVTLRRARLVLGWVTIFVRVYHHGT